MDKSYSWTPFCSAELTAAMTTLSKYPAWSQCAVHFAKSPHCLLRQGGGWWVLLFLAVCCFLVGNFPPCFHESPCFNFMSALILWAFHLCAFLSSSVCCLEFPRFVFQTLQRCTESSKERRYSSYTCLPSCLLTICSFSSYSVLTYFSIYFHCFWGCYVSSPLSYLHLTIPECWQCHLQTIPSSEG